MPFFLIWRKDQKTKQAKNTHTAKNKVYYHINNIKIAVLDLEGHQGLYGNPLLKLLSIVVALSTLIEQSDQDSLMEATSISHSQV